MAKLRQCTQLPGNGHPSLLPGGARPPVVPDSHVDLLSGGRATLATIEPDGRPRLSPVRFVEVGDTLAVWLEADSPHVVNLRRDPQCAVLLTDGASPERAVELRGDAQVRPDVGHRLAGRMAAKYGPRLHVLRADPVEGVAIRLRPLHVQVTDRPAGGRHAGEAGS